MWDILVKIYVSLFVPKKKRAEVKYSLQGWPNRMRALKRARKVGKNLQCGRFPVTVSRNTELGDNVILNGLFIQGSGDVIIGNHVKIGTETIILSDNHNYNGEAIPFDDVCIAKTVRIGDFAWLGTRVLLLPGTTIGEGAIIQAGSVVHGEIPPCAIAGGNPAKVFRMRDTEKFYRLKSEGKFSNW